MLITVASYAVVLAAVLCGLPTLAAFPAGLLLCNLPGRIVGPLLSSAFVWGGIAYAWQWVEGDQMPLIVFVAAFLWVGWCAQERGVGLGGFVVAGCEQCAIVFAAVGAAVASGGVRWV